ncbi:hypothetical protein GCM10029963_45970 [Micromonospora andamanensis]
MGSVQIVTTILAAAITAVAVWLAVRAVSKMVAVIRLGQPDPTRSGDKASRTRTMLAETAGHTRMLRWSVVGAAHWFVMVGFVVLSLLVLEAYFEVVSPTGGLPIIGSWTLYGLVTEWIGILGVIGIAVLIAIRLANRPNRAGRRSRFTGSTMWQGYFVEAVVLAVLVMGFVIRGFKVATDHFEYPTWATPLSHAVGALLPGWESGVSVAALIKISISMAWVIVISLNVTMGVAWHRFLAFPNIFFKRQPGAAGSGLGALRPMMSDGKPLDFEEADPEKDQFGVAQVEQFTWKGLLDFSTCTECGRCQSQCPAWNTGKPLSPKLLVLSLRDHAYAKAPYLLAGGGKDLTGEEKATAAQLAHVDVLALAEAEKPLIGDAEAGGVIDPDVLWSCTTCGACVEQCPVDIEHVDHIVDMRRYQVLIESSFPSEAGVMLRNLENKGNPWGHRRTPGRTGPRASTSRCPGSARSTTSSTSSGWVAPVRSRTGRRRPPGPSRPCSTRRASPSPSSARGDLLRRPGPADRQRVRFPDARPAERRDPERGVRGSGEGQAEDRRDLPALLQHAGQRVRPARR